MVFGSKKTPLSKLLVHLPSSLLKTQHLQPTGRVTGIPPLQPLYLRRVRLQTHRLVIT